MPTLAPSRQTLTCAIPEVESKHTIDLFCTMHTAYKPKWLVGLMVSGPPTQLPVIMKIHRYWVLRSGSLAAEHSSTMDMFYSYVSLV